VKLLLAAGARVDTLNAEDGTSVLHDAAAGGYTTIIRWLVDAAREQLDGRGAAGAGAAAEPSGEQQQADGEAKEEKEGEGATPAQQQQPGAEEEDKEDDTGARPPSAVAAPNPPRSLSDLINLQDSEGETALHNAARGNHVEAVRCLLSLGADPYIAANDGALPVEEPEDDGVAAIIEEFMNEGASGEGEGDADAEA